LVVAEAPEDRVVLREVVIDANIAGPFIRSSYWHVDVIESRGICIRGGIELHHFCPDRIDHGCRNDVAVFPGRLRPIRANRLGCGGSGLALKWNASKRIV